MKINLYVYVIIGVVVNFGGVMRMIISIIVLVMETTGSM